MSQTSARIEAHARKDWSRATYDDAPSMRGSWALAALCVTSFGCAQGARERDFPDAAPPPAADGVPDAAGAADAEASSAAEDAGRDAGPLPGRTDGCPDGMLRVEGSYCPAVMQ